MAELLQQLSFFKEQSEKHSDENMKNIMLVTDLKLKVERETYEKRELRLLTDEKNRENEELRERLNNLEIDVNRVKEIQKSNSEEDLFNLKESHALQQTSMMQSMSSLHDVTSPQEAYSLNEMIDDFLEEGNACIESTESLDLYSQREQDRVRIY